MFTCLQGSEIGFQHFSAFETERMKMISLFNCFLHVTYYIKAQPWTKLYLFFLWMGCWRNKTFNCKCYLGQISPFYLVLSHLDRKWGKFLHWGHKKSNNNLTKVLPLPHTSIICFYCYLCLVGEISHDFLFYLTPIK